MKSMRRVGEFGLIERLRAKTKTAAPVVVGIGDDAAVLRVRPGWDQLLTTDMLVEGRHFRLKDATLEEIGWKAMAVNLSDIAAMGGLPKAAVVAVGLPKRFSVRQAESLFRGLSKAARRFGTGIAGGDTNASNKLVIAVTLLGEVERGRAVLRSGARVGDEVWVTGRLGGSLASRHHLRFTPRVREARWLIENFKVHAMMDLSDGLASDLRRMAQESGVGFRIDGQAVPRAVYPKSPVSLKAALSDGEDFELLFTMPARESQKLRRSRRPVLMTPIGTVTHRGRGIRLAFAGKERPLEEKGYDHFKK